MVANASEELVEKNQMIANTKSFLGCQMFLTKPCINMVFSKSLYISVVDLCKFLTQYTSYEVRNIVKNSTPK
jgi:hypothetical protein